MKRRLRHQLEATFKLLPLIQMNRKTRTTLRASEGTSVRLQHSTAAILLGLFTLCVFCCGFVAGKSNESSSEDSQSVSRSSISTVTTAISAYSSHTLEINSSSKNGKYEIHLLSTLGMIFPHQRGSSICLYHAH